MLQAAITVVNLLRFGARATVTFFVRVFSGRAANQQPGISRSSTRRSLQVGEGVIGPQSPANLLWGRRGHARVAVLTVIPEEMEAARQAFAARSRIPNTNYYYDQEYAAGNYRVIVGRCANRTNSQAAAAVRDIIEYFRPAIIMLVGVAGGLEHREGVALGDVVVADYVEYMEFLKIDDNGVHLRYLPLDQPSVALRTESAEPIAREGRWVEGIIATRPIAGVPKAVVGMVVAGEKIMSNEHDGTQKALLQPFGKAIAVDMESKGVAEAICAARTSVWYNPRYLVVRGISDIVEREEKPEDISPVTSNPDRVVQSQSLATPLQGAGSAHGVPAPLTNAAQRDLWRDYAAAAAASLAAAIANDLVERVYEF